MKQWDWNWFWHPHWILPQRQNREAVELGIHWIEFDMSEYFIQSNCRLYIKIHLSIYPFIHQSRLLIRLSVISISTNNLTIHWFSYTSSATIRSSLFLLSMFLSIQQYHLLERPRLRFDCAEAASSKERRGSGLINQGSQSDPENVLFGFFWFWKGLISDFLN